MHATAPLRSAASDDADVAACSADAARGVASVLSSEAESHVEMAEATTYRSLALELDLGDAVEAADEGACLAVASQAVNYSPSKAATLPAWRMDAGGVVALADALQPANEAEMAPLLDDMRVEPDNDEERAAKFEIYEVSAAQFRAICLRLHWLSCCMGAHRREVASLRFGYGCTVCART